MPGGGQGWEWADIRMMVNPNTCLGCLYAFYLKASGCFPQHPQLTGSSILSTAKIGKLRHREVQANEVGLQMVSVSLTLSMWPHAFKLKCSGKGTKT